jgi:serine/threonine protein kinase
MILPKTGTSDIVAPSMTDQRQFGPYTLTRKLASGGMAEIYLARTQGIEGFEKNLVLKMIHPKWSQDKKFISMLVEEAKLAVQLNHSSIAQVFDLGLHDGQYYIAMEFVDGRDLFQLLVRTSELDEYLPFDVAAHIAREIAAALNYAHSRNDAQGRNLKLIHRDVSPQNIIVSFHGEVKLIDFGIAKAAMRPAHTQVGIIKGKFYYMSPEQASGRQLDHRSDLFSLGICLHEMLTGQMLYSDEDQHDLLDKVRKADVPRPSQLRDSVPRELDDICMRALTRDPSQRYQSGFELQQALTEYLHRSAAGFTSQRLTAVMGEFFPAQQSTPVAPEPLPASDNAPLRSPQSVIFDLSAAGRRSAAADDIPETVRGEIPLPVHEASDPTQPVPQLGEGRPPPVFGDGHDPAFEPGRPSHPPPPISSEQMPQDSTRIMNWDSFRSRHPERSPADAQPSNLRKSNLPPPTIDDERTVMFTPPTNDGAIGGPPSDSPQAGQLRRTTSIPTPSADPDEHTVMFKPGDHKDDSEHTTLFEPHKKIIQGTPGSASSPGDPGEAMPHERTMMFNPAEAGLLIKSPEVDEDDPHTVPLTFSAVLEDTGPGAIRPAPADSSESRQGENGNDAGPSPDDEQEKLAARVKAAKAKRAAEKGGADQDDLAARVKAAKAKRAAGKEGGNDDLAARVKAAKARKAAGAASASDGAGAEDSTPGQKSASVNAAKAMAKRRAGKTPAVGAPKRATPKGNARSNVRIAGQTRVFGIFDAASPTGRVIKKALPVMLVLFAFGFVVTCAGGYALLQQFQTKEGPQYGTIGIDSTPSGATVFVDGTRLDAKTPYTIEEAEVGNAYDIRLELENFKPWLKREVAVVEDKEALQINAQLERLEGSIDVFVNVPATVKLGEETRCLDAKRCTLKELKWLPGGFIEIAVEAEGFETEEIVIQWPEDEEDPKYGPNYEHEVTLIKAK